jgi:hypothetical protein
MRSIFFWRGVIALPRALFVEGIGRRFAVETFPRTAGGAFRFIAGRAL